MNKSFRQGQILKVLRGKEIFTQEELGRELGLLGIRTTQVTLSRDMRELNLVKTSEGYRPLSSGNSRADVASIANEYLLDIHVAQNLLVLRTAPGHASPLAIALDQDDWEEVVGTIAGDDTVLVISADNETAARCRQRLIDLLSA